MTEQAAAEPQSIDAGLGEGSEPVEPTRQEIQPVTKTSEPVEAPQISPYSCEKCAREFDSVQGLRGHLKIHKPSKPSKQGQLTSEESGNEISELQSNLAKERIERQRLEEELKKIKTERELEALKAPQKYDPVDSELTKYLKAKTIKELAPPTESVIHNGADPQLAKEIETLRKERDEARSELHDKELSDRLLTHINKSLAGFESNVKDELEKVKQNQVTDPKSAAMTQIFTTIRDELKNLHTKGDLVLNWLLGPQAKQFPIPKETSPNPMLDELARQGYVTES